MKHVFPFCVKSTMINCRGQLVDLSVPKIMGILNVTPDSFSDGGAYVDLTKALKQVEQMVNEGADIIDIGPQSTRPNATQLTAKEEIERLGKVISEIKKRFPHTLISIDTFYSDTVKFGYEEGIDIINDISGGQFDERMLEVVAETKLPYVLMHINPSYQEMHQQITYENLTNSINYYFIEKIAQLKSLGIKDIILDPGFGFGKTVKDQEKMLEEVEHLGLGLYPILIGISRKSFIYKPLNKTPLEIDEETQERHRVVLEKGANILRVHDVASTKRTVDLYMKKSFM